MRIEIRSITLGAVAALAIVAAFMDGCRQGPVQVTEGTSSETIIGRVFLPDGLPAANVPYRVRDIRFLADPSAFALSKPSSGSRNASAGRDGVTGMDGGYRLDSLAPGEYQAEFGDLNGHGLLIPLAVGADGGGIPGRSDTMRVSGNLSGTLVPANAAVRDSTFRQAFVQVYGMDRVVPVDTATGRFFIPALPAGRFRLRAFSPFPFLQSTELAGVEVRPGATIDLDSIPLIRILNANFTSLVSEGLIAYWPFDEGAGSVTVDPVGGYDGRLEGNPAWTQGRKGGALAFGGKADHVSVPTLYLPEDFTIAAWVRLRGIIDNNQVLLGMEDSCNLNFAQGKFRLYSGVAGSGPDSMGNGSLPYDPVISTNTIQANTWTHVAVMRRSGTLTIFHDGHADAGGTWSGTFLFNRIGRGLQLTGTSRNTGYLQGDLDELRVYNRYLSPTEIAALANVGVP